MTGLMPGHRQISAMVSYVPYTHGDVTRLCAFLLSRFSFFLHLSPFFSVSSSLWLVKDAAVSVLNQIDRAKMLFVPHGSLLSPSLATVYACCSLFWCEHGLPPDVLRLREVNNLLAGSFYTTPKH